MSARAHMIISAIKKNLSDDLLTYFMHFVAIMSLDAVLIYFLKIQHTLLSFVLAGLLWFMVLRDYKYQKVDIRFCLMIVAIGCYIKLPTSFSSVYAGIMMFLILHTIHESCAVIESTENGTFGSFKYKCDYNKISTDTAPAYIPIFIATMFVLFSYYMIGFPISPVIENILFNDDFDIIFNQYLPIFVLPLAVLSIFAIYFYRRNHIAMKNGHNIVYRGAGDGDIYFIGSMTAILGFFVTLIIVFFSTIPAYYFINRWQSCKED